jgi:hypothetical protein
MRGSRVIQEWVGKLVSRMRVRLWWGRKLAHLMLDSRVIREWVGKLVSRNAIRLDARRWRERMVGIPTSQELSGRSLLGHFPVFLIDLRLVLSSS